MVWKLFSTIEGVQSSISCSVTENLRSSSAGNVAMRDMARDVRNMQSPVSYTAISFVAWNSHGVDVLEFDIVPMSTKTLLVFPDFFIYIG